MVQRRDDRGRAEPDVRLQKLIGDAAANRVVLGREERKAQGGRARPGPTVRVAGAAQMAAPDTSDGRPNWDYLWLSSHGGSVSH